MSGLVLAAGPGRRLHPLTDALPKTLLPLDRRSHDPRPGARQPRAVGLEDVVVVTGFAAERVQERADDLERLHRVRLKLVFNDRAEEWNNAYSLWLARESFREGALLVNGDTVHPVAVEESLLAARGPDVFLAVDRQKPLGEEEMKVRRLPTRARCAASASMWTQPRPTASTSA